MPVHGFTPILLCFLPLWRILILVSSHPQHGPCTVMLRTALCNKAKFSSVPAGLPDNIEELQLNYNHIKTLRDNSLLHYPSLNSLSLACNSLDRLESNTFQNASLLENLNLANNNLNIGYQETSLALRNLPGLRILDLSENLLDDDMVSMLLQNLTSLEYLNLSGNLLKRLDENSFKHLHKLKDLDLQKNTIFEIDGAFESNPNLQRLNLAFNYLPCLTDFHLTQLVLLNASFNSIEWFMSRQDLNDTFQLETLDLSNNRLLFFPFLPSQSQLRNLYLSRNTLRFYEHLMNDSSLPNLTKTVEFYNLKKHMDNVTAELWRDDLHGDISGLEILDLRGNQVEYFPQGFIQKMPALSRLRMSTNCLETLNLTSEQFSGSLYELDVSNNLLSQVLADNASLATLGNLTYFNLSLNDVNQLPFGLFSSLPSIRSVDLSYNNIIICLSDEAENNTQASPACVDWRNIVSLKQLYLKGCSLKRIPASAFTGLSLTHVELSDNPGLIIQDSLQTLTGTLQHLGLGNTQIQDIDFSYFQKLMFLNLSKNSLTKIPSSVKDIELKVLDMRDNRLLTIPSSQANALALKLQTIFLTGNPFDCCQQEWFTTFKDITPNIFGQPDIRSCQELSSAEESESPCWKGEHMLWYIVLLLSIVLILVGIIVMFLLTFKSEMLQKSIKKTYLKPTSY